MIKILIVTSCTGQKKAMPDNKLTQQDFLDSNILNEKEKVLSEFSYKAGVMYTGMQHLRLMEGISLLRQHYGIEVVDLNIVSAGYGLIDEEKVIVPYEVTFNEMNNEEISKWSSQLNIHNDLQNKIDKYDLIFFLLGDKYLRSLELPLEVRDDQKLIFFASPTSRMLIPRSSAYYFVEVEQDDATSFGYGLIGLKGYLFKLLAQEATTKGKEIFEKIYDNPELILETLNKYRKIDKKDISKSREKKSQQLKLEFFVPKEVYARNYGQGMLYFIPECDDRVDPGYNFITDMSVENRDPYTHDVYAHEIYDQPNYDGILVSKGIIEKSKNKRALIEEQGIHDFIRFPSDKPIMGDCGAFSYIDLPEPPYQTEEILEYYQSLGFNYGVSIDHLIVGDIGKNPEERDRRYKLTMANAEDFLKRHKEGQYTFTPIGVAQGWNPESYRKAVEDLVAMGYGYVSLGGLARSTTKEILEILEGIAPVVPDYLQMHLFGVARLDAVDTFRKLGVTSFDSASYLRKAWLSSSSNYFGVDGNRYAAIRIPQVEGTKVKKLVDAGQGTFEDFKVLEQESLNALRKFDRGEIDLEDVLKVVVDYTEVLGEDWYKYEKLYRRVLEDQPWKRCDCKICREHGIEVIIFRGNNRNRRRGFHNTYVFYKEFTGE